jgi:hypothetical protein
MQGFEMTNNNHTITPPPELVQQWVAEIWHEGTPVRVALSEEHIATRAAQWGADQELEACIDWMKRMGYWGDDGKAIPAFRAARRPKPLSLKEQALEEVGVFEGMGTCNIDIIRRALESLP